jgi:hypothetical protein
MGGLHRSVEEVGELDLRTMHLNRWWDGQEAERYWLETTDRTDLGVDLKAPQTRDDGSEYWSYSLVKEVSDGDIVFHYHKPQRKIVGCSTVVGEYWEEPIVWASHGTVARDAGVVPYRRPGWRIAVERFVDLDEPVTLELFRQEEPELRKMLQRLKSEHDGSLYFPIEFSDRRPLRPAQGYLFKLPHDFVSHFTPLSRTAEIELRVAAEGEGSTTTSMSVGCEYRTASEEAATSERDPFAVDPSIVDRGLRGHAKTQNWLADEVRSLGMDPRSPGPGDVNFDLAWKGPDGTVYVAEVKSTTPSNEEKQLRLGLGQVLRYRQLLSADGGHVRSVLAIEEPPSDPRWLDLCREVGVSLVWPGEPSI